MKLACTADWHVHNFTDFSSMLNVIWTGKRFVIADDADDDENIWNLNSRLWHILDGICDIRDYCVDNNINIVLFAGDMFHHRGSIDVTVFNALRMVLDTFYDYGLDIIAIPGNHDQVDNSRNPLSSLTMYSEYLDICNRPQIHIIDGVSIVALPYSSDKQYIISELKKAREELQRTGKDPKDAILMCHCGITGATVGSGKYVMSDEYTLKELMYDKWHYVVVGHYHQPQLLSYNAFYCGTPVQSNFGDELNGKDGYNGFFVIDTDKRFDVRFVPIHAPRFVTVNSSDELAKLDPTFIESNYIRVKTTAEDAEDLHETLVDKLGENQAPNVRLELEKDYSVVHRSDVGVTQTVEETVVTYAQEIWDDEETLDYITNQGLSILEQAQV